MSFREPKFPASTSPPRPRRYAWCKIPNEFADFPALRAAALIARVRVAEVVAVALRLECLANAAVPRGSIADFSAAEFAAALQLRPDVVARIRVALEDPQVFWICQDFLTGFSARNPESSDPTAVERQRRHRARLKAQQEALAQSEGASGAAPRRRSVADFTEPIHSHVTSRRDVTVSRCREEENRNPLCREDGRAREAVDKCAEAAESTAGAAGGLALDDEETALLWLAGEGLRLVTEQGLGNPQRVATIVARWRDQDLGGDACALATLIRGAAGSGLFGERFLNLIVDGIRDHNRRAGAQRELPLPAIAAARKLG